MRHLYAPGVSRPPVSIPVLLEGLERTIPLAATELRYRSHFQLLVAVLLSAQMTDKGVNAATPALFRAYGDARRMAKASVEQILPFLATINYRNTKAKHLAATARILVVKHGGTVPRTMEELVALPGIGRKSANVLLSSMNETPVGIAVDTHVARVAKRMGLTMHTDPVKVERDLMRAIPTEYWTKIHHQLVLHGRYVCVARAPKCGSCVFRYTCPSSL